MIAPHPILVAHYAAGLSPLTQAQEDALDDLIIGLEAIHCAPNRREVEAVLNMAAPVQATLPPSPPARSLVGVE